MDNDVSGHQLHPALETKAGMQLFILRARRAPPQHVDIDGDDDHEADQDLLPERADIVDIEAVAQQAHDQHAGEHAEDRAAAAEEARRRR